MKDPMVLEIGGVQYLMTPIEDPEEMVGRKWIAEYLGVAQSTISRTPWNLPDLGLEKHKNGATPYRKCEVIAWLGKPVNKRMEIYKEKTRNETNELN